MSPKIAWAKCRLQFYEPAITSRNILREKGTYFLKLINDRGSVKYAECALFSGLSAEDNGEYEKLLSHACRHYDEPGVIENLPASLNFGFTSLVMDSHDVEFKKWMRGISGIRTNGLVWMGTCKQMLERAKQKVEAGFKVIKFKVGGQDFSREVDMLTEFRSRYPKEEITIRLDANGAFKPSEAMKKLEILAKLDVHSIEQPIRQGQIKEMHLLSKESPISIALDEELIGIKTKEEAEKLLDEIKPQFLVIKPSLTGWIQGANFIKLAQDRGIGWWGTSALESNIGLADVARFILTYGKDNPLPHGLGLGNLYLNNPVNDIILKGEMVYHQPGLKPDFEGLRWQS